MPRRSTRPRATRSAFVPIVPERTSSGSARQTAPIPSRSPKDRCGPRWGAGLQTGARSFSITPGPARSTSPVLAQMETGQPGAWRHSDITRCSPQTANGSTRARKPASCGFPPRVEPPRRSPRRGGFRSVSRGMAGTCSSCGTPTRARCGGYPPAPAGFRRRSMAWCPAAPVAGPSPPMASTSWAAARNRLTGRCSTCGVS